MKNQITIDEVEDIFNRKISLVGERNESSLLDRYLNVAMELQSLLSIENVDDDVEKDFLSFSYGCYPSQHNSKKHPTIHITRHFNPNEFNGVFRYTYSLELHFDEMTCKKRDLIGIYSKDFESLTSWYEEIKRSSVYSYFEKFEPAFSQSQLIEHKHGW